MGKFLVVAAFLITLTLAVYTFFTRNTATPRQNLIAANSKEPRVVLEEFSVYRYTGHKVSSILSANQGHLIEPNIIEVSSEIRGIRYGAKDPQTLACDSATGYFQADHLGELMSDAGLARAEIRGNVVLGVGKETLLTEYAEYLASRGVLVTKAPVEIQGPNRSDQEIVDSPST